MLTARIIGRVNEARQGTISRAKGDHSRVFISRGMAALIAIQDVLDNNPQARLALEAVEEPSSIAGHPSPEWNYVGVEPWIVFLVDPYQERHYVIAVGAGRDR
jgi:hypothetical protein